MVCQPDHCYFWHGITTPAHEKQSSWAPSLLQHRDRNNWASLKVCCSRIFKAWDVSSLSQGLAGVTDQIVFTDCAFRVCTSCVDKENTRTKKGITGKGSNLGFEQWLNQSPWLSGQHQHLDLCQSWTGPAQRLLLWHNLLYNGWLALWLMLSNPSHHH